MRNVQWPQYVTHFASFSPKINVLITSMVIKLIVKMDSEDKSFCQKWESMENRGQVFSFVVISKTIIHVNSRIIFNCTSSRGPQKILSKTVIAMSTTWGPRPHQLSWITEIVATISLRAEVAKCCAEGEYFRKRLHMSRHGFASFICKKTNDQIVMGSIRCYMRHTVHLQNHSHCWSQGKEHFVKTACDKTTS